MNKLYLVLVLLISSLCVAQNNNSVSNFFVFKTNNLDLKANYFENKTLSNRLIQEEKRYSIYNPKPGFKAIEIISQNYYSFANTNNLLGKEMKNIEKEPIFPEVKKESLADKIVSAFLTSVLE